MNKMVIAKKNEFKRGGGRLCVAQLIFSRNFGGVCLFNQLLFLTVSFKTILNDQRHYIHSMLY